MKDRDRYGVWEEEDCTYLTAGYGDLDKLKRTRMEISKYIKEELNPQGITLDFGSGMGLIAREIAPCVKELHCCDISSTFLQKAQENCSGLSNVSYHLIDPGELKFPDGSFDSIYSVAVFIHFSLMEVYHHFREFYRILKPGGKALFNIYLASNFHLENFVGAYEEVYRTPNRWVLQTPPHDETVVRKLLAHVGFTCDHPPGRWYMLIQK